MISYVGEEAVSGVSLVNMFFTIFIYIFVALASGGAVVVSQYIGNKNKKNAELAAGQIIMIASLLSLIFMLVILTFNNQLLNLLFGQVEQEVMDASIIYLKIAAYSLPALALYNGSGALYRSMGKNKTIMYVSLVTNVINMVGNAIGIFVLKAGVAGVAWPSFISRVFAALVMLLLCFKASNDIVLKLRDILAWNKDMVKRILSIALPNSIENGLFQFAKVALSAITALFGTSQIAANGIAQSFWSLSALVGVAMGPAFITVIGQSMGAKNFLASDYYMKKLLRITFFASIAWNGLIGLMTPFVLNLYDISDKTKQMVIVLVMIHNIANSVIFPISSPFANGLRASGDVKFTMYVSFFSTVIVRVALSIVFGIWLNLGVTGIALAMVCDWSVRAMFNILRYKSGRWKAFTVI
jgi:putative MATE family efflux protein